MMKGERERRPEIESTLPDGRKKYDSSLGQTREEIEAGLRKAKEKDHEHAGKILGELEKLKK